MTEDRIMQQEQPWKPAWLEWIIYPSCLAIAHFYLLFVLSLSLAYRMPWALHPFMIFALAAEAGLKAVTNYRGEDSLQWPIIFINSLLYGIVIYWAWCYWRRRRHAP